MDRTLTERLIDLYNDQFAQIFAAVKERGNEGALRDRLISFCSRPVEYAQFFQGVSIGADGRLDHEQILRNLAATWHSRKINCLNDVLNEFLDCMLFNAAQAMGHRDALVFEQRVQAILAEAAREGGAAGEGRGADLPADRQVSDAPIGVVDLQDPVTALAPADLSEMLGDPDPEARFEPLSGVDPMPPSGRMSVAIVPYLPDAQAYELASGLRACRSDATLALERAEQIASHVGPDELREIALRCREHAASVIRALDELDQLVARLRRR